MSPRDFGPEHFPKLIQVGAATYHVVFFSKLKDDDAGYCDFDGKIIAISLNQPKVEYLETFIHEALHAIEHEFKCPLGHPKIRKLEVALAQIFRMLLPRA